MSPAGGTQLQSTDPQKTTSEQLTPQDIMVLAARSLNASEPDTPEADRCPPMLPFIKAILDAAVVFIDDTLPTTFEPHSNKSSTPAKTRFELLQRNISAKELSKVDWQGSKIPRHPPDNVASEAWFARRSRHANQQAKGTANFSEFDYGLRIDHCQHEGDYTPEVYDTFKVLEWKIPDALAKVESDFADYQNITMSSTYRPIVHVFLSTSRIFAWSMIGPAIRCLVGSQPSIADAVIESVLS